MMLFGTHLGRLMQLVGAVVLGCTLTGLGAEKIRFDDASSKPVAPDAGSGREIERSFDLRGPSSRADGVAPAPSLAPPAATARDPKIDEFLDQKKNWIFSTPSKLDSDATVRKMFGVRETPFGGAEAAKRNGSTIERYFEREAEHRREISANTRSRNNDRTSPSEQDERVDRNDPTVTETQSATPSAQPGFGAPGTAEGGSYKSSIDSRLPISGFTSPQVNPTTTGLFGESVSRRSSQFDPSGLGRTSLGAGSSSRISGTERRSLEFQKILAPLMGSSGASLDPINRQSDGTRQPINPIVGNGLNAPNFNSLGGLPGSSLSPSIPGMGLRSGLADLGDRRMPGADGGLNGSLLPRSATPFAPVRPPTLEIPRRKY